MSNRNRYPKQQKNQKPTGGMSPITEWVPVRVDTSAPAVDADRFDLFYIDDQAYTAPCRVPAGVALEALSVAFNSGPTAAAWFIIDKTVGEENIKLLYDQPSLTLDECQRMLTKLGEVFWGQVQDMVGKSPAGETS